MAFKRSAVRFRLAPPIKTNTYPLRGTSALSTSHQTIMRKKLIGTLLFAGLLLTAACGGGGNNSPTTALQPAPTPEPTTPTPPEPIPAPDFNTSEYQLNYGLGAIHALNAYEDGLTGEGILVAIIDSGLDPTHPDLANNISPNSTDIIIGRDDLAHVVGDDDFDGQHGAIVSGVVAAEKNDFGAHGVAFEAQILAIRADNPDTCDDYNTNGCYFDNDLARAVDYAVANDSDIINLSLGGFLPNNEELVAAYDAAVAAGVIIIFAAGNAAFDSPMENSLYALTQGAGGQAIIVGATDSQNNIWVGSGEDPYLSAGSNKAGANAQGSFLVAPGADIYSACNPAWYCSDASGLTVALSGTSLAAPHVAGAAALLLQKFPNLSAAEVVEILMVTAQDLGDAGPDAVFGMGLIDLAAAIAPIGQISVSTNNGEEIPFDGGSIKVSAAFGDALTASPSAVGAFSNVLATDSYDRTYQVSLVHTLTTLPDQRFNISSRAQSRIYSRHHAFSAPGLGMVEIGYMERWGALDEEDLFSNFNRDSTSKPLNVSFKLQRELNPNTIISLHHGSALSEKFINIGNQSGASIFGGGDSFMRFANDGTGISLQRLISAQTRLTVLATYADYRPYQDSPELSRSLRAAQLDHQLNDRFGVFLRIGSIHEVGSTLNMVADGSYDAFGSATTIFATFNMAYQYEDWSFALGGSFGSTNTGKSDGAFFSDVSTLHSTDFSLVAKWHVPRPGHFLSFGVSQPLRVENGSVSITAPTARDMTTEAFSFTSQDLSLSPSGREIDLEIGHLFHGPGGFSLATNLVYRLNPGHSKTASQAVAFLCQLQFGF